MAYGNIYSIVNKINGKTYVGQTIGTIEHRFSQHKHSSKRENTYLYNAMKKYGIENFTIKLIDTANSLEELNNKEIYWIKKLNTKYPYGYNILDGGKSIKGYHHTEKTKMLLKQKSIGNQNALGKHNISVEGINNMLLAHRGKESGFKNKNHSEKVKNELSISHSKKVQCVETLEIFPSSLIASQKLKITNHIGRCCSGERKTCGGYHWRWV